jgi:pimeloyl-ACP methyl ester carboxylesterase
VGSDFSWRETSAKINWSKDKMSTLDPQQFAATLLADPEFLHRLFGFEGVLRISAPPVELDVVVEPGKPPMVRPQSGDAQLEVVVPSEMLAQARQQVPPPGTEALFRAAQHGAEVRGDLASFAAPYAGLLSRVYDLLRRSGSDVIDVPLAGEPFADTDTAVGRYVRVTVDGITYRIFYEESGSGIPLLLQHTAGADGRQWRNQLADPAFQQRFRVIAYDLPYHGRSLPPTSEQWWTRDYRTTKDWFIKMVLGIMDALKIEKPIFMGCSVGGQLALDLAVNHADRFRALVAINGTLDNPMAGNPFADHWNNVCRDNRVTNDNYAMGNFNATSPLAPEPLRREVYWIYRSNFQGVYAGDNDYFMHYHDLKVDGQDIRTDVTPVYALAGEYDPVAVLEDHGSPAVAKRFPGVEYRFLPGLGHFCPSDDPVRFNAAVLPILEEAVNRQRPASA